MKSFYYLLTVAFLYQCQPLPAQTLGVESLPGKPGAIPVYVNPGLLGDSGITTDDISGKLNRSDDTATNLTVKGLTVGYTPDWDSPVIEAPDEIYIRAYEDNDYSQIYFDSWSSRPLFRHYDGYESLYYNNSFAFISDITNAVNSAVSTVRSERTFLNSITSPRLEIVSDTLMTVEQDVEWTTNKVWEFGAATNWIHPSRLDIGSEYYSLKGSLSESLWNDCVFAWSAELPVQNAGKTSAKWLGWEPLKTSFVQTSQAAQPARTNYQGRAADFYNGSHYITAQQPLLGDVDLYAYSTNQWTVCQRVACESNAVLRAVGKSSAGSVSFAYSLGLNRPAAAAYTPYIYINGAATASGLSHDDGQWHHYAVTWDGTTAQLYADGIYVMDCNVGTNANLAVSNPVGIGKTGTGYGTGYISDMMIFNRPLTATEIEELANQ